VAPKKPPAALLAGALFSDGNGAVTRSPGEKDCACATEGSPRSNPRAAQLRQGLRMNLPCRSTSFISGNHVSGDKDRTQSALD
jgi:hypothetical protein